MVNEYTTIYMDGYGEYEEKKSRFLCTVYHVEGEEEIASILQSTRKKYYDARHHCYAYILGQGMEIKKCSDDGEPSGTAGFPILSVLEGRNVTNVLAVVTRYFGGTLLGTGGLVRSYTKACQEAFENAVLAKKSLADVLEVHTDYNGLGKIQYLLAKEELPQPEIMYADTVKLTIPVPTVRTEEIIRKITDATSGKAAVQKVDEKYFAVINKEIVFFEE